MKPTPVEPICDVFRGVRCLWRSFHPSSSLAVLVLLVLASCAKDETTLTKFGTVDSSNDTGTEPVFGGGVPTFDAGSVTDDACAIKDCADVDGPTPSQCTLDSDCSTFVPALQQCTAIQCASDGICEVDDDPSLACDPATLPNPPGLLCKLSGEKGDAVRCPVRVVRKHAEVDGPVNLTFELNYPGLLAGVVAAWVLPCAPMDSCAPVLVPPASIFPNGHTLTTSPSPWSAWTDAGSVTIVPPTAQPTARITDAYLSNLGAVVGNDFVFEIEFQLNVRLLVPAPVVINNIVAKAADGQLLPAIMSEERIVVGSDKPVDPCEDPADCPVIVPPNAVCQVVGNSGETVVCPIGLVRAAATSAIPSSLDFSLEYDPLVLDFQGFQAYPCEDWNCDPQDVPPSAMPLTGHDVTLAPASPAAWAGLGAITVSNSEGDPKALSEVYLAAGQPVGSPHFIEAVFQLVASQPATTPAFVSLLDVSASGGQGEPLSVSLLNNWIVVDGPPQCPWADGCDDPPDPPDVPPGSICAVSGVVGQIVDCEIRLARVSVQSQLATALQGVLEYDPQALKLDNFYDTNCYQGIGCFEVPCAGSQAKPLSSGHSMSTAPLTPSAWNGAVGMVIANISDPTIPLTDATLMADGKTVQGDSLFVLARFVIQKPLVQQMPSLVTIIKTLGSSAGAVSLPASIQNQIIVTQ